jgi:hypothetical protein
MNPLNPSIGTRISNNFSSGVYRDFESAMVALKAAYADERSTDDDLGQTFWDEQIAEVEQAQEIYDRHMTGVKEKIVLELREQGLDQFADALETGDYSVFAY